MKFKNLKSVTILFTADTKTNASLEFTRNINIPFIPDIGIIRTLSMTHQETSGGTHIYGLRSNIDIENSVLAVFRASPSGNTNNIFRPNKSTLQQATFQLVQATVADTQFVPVTNIFNVSLGILITIVFSRIRGLILLGFGIPHHLR